MKKWIVVAAVCVVWLGAFTAYGHSLRRSERV